MNTEANLTEDVVAADLINHEAVDKTDSDQKGRIGNPHKTVSKRKLPATQGSLLLIRVKYSVTNARSLDIMQLDV
jgi:hypothetical protein